MINGVIKTIDFVSANGGVVTQIGSPVTNIEINVGTLAPTQTKDVTVTFLVPEGVNNETVIKGDVRVSGQDDDNCEPLNSLTSFDFKVLSLAKVEGYKSRDESVIPSKGDIHYQLNYKGNLRIAPAHNLYIIDKIPSKTVFKAAYTSGLDENGNSFNCGGCKAYFSQSMPSLPAGVSPLEVFDLSYITSAFTVGTEVSAGKWTSPFGFNTIWVAYLADNTALK